MLLQTSDVSSQHARFHASPPSKGERAKLNSPPHSQPEGVQGRPSILGLERLWDPARRFQQTCPRGRQIAQDQSWTPIWELAKAACDSHSTVSKANQCGPEAQPGT